MKSKLYLMLLVAVLFSSYSLSSNSVRAEGDVVIYLLAGEDLKFNQTEIIIPLGVKVTVFVEAKGAFHTFTLDDDTIKDEDGSLIDLGVNQDTVANITFTSPLEEMEVRFYCIPHQASGMEGIFKFTDNTEEAPIAPFAIILGIISIALLKRKNK